LNYTRFEPELSAEWKRRFSLSLTTKFVFDWEQSETSGLMLELEGGWNFGRHWRAVVTLGKGLMDTSVPTGYAKKLEFSLRYNF
jgi:hypothetical protein